MGSDYQERLKQAFRRAGLLCDTTSPDVAKTLICRQAEQIAADLNVPLRDVECFALDHGVMPLRYISNIGTFKVSGQIKLLQSRVLVVGLGGLGGHVVEQLARAGVGRIAAVDPDAFEEKNLNRQLFCTSASLGNQKVFEVGQRLKQINPAAEFSGYSMTFQQLSDEVFINSDLVFDCLDSADARLALKERCSSTNRVLIHAAVDGWCGQVGLVLPNSELIQKVYGKKRRGIEQSFGNPPFTPAVIASLAAALGVKVLLSKTPPMSQCLRFIDLLNDEWEHICFRLP